MLRNGSVLQRDELKVQAFFWHGSRLFMAAAVVFASNVPVPTEAVGRPLRDKRGRTLSNECPGLSQTQEKELSTDEHTSHTPKKKPDTRAATERKYQPTEIASRSTIAAPVARVADATGQNASDIAMGPALKP